ncbi:hypothetical protein GH714_042076 [Hevea brasiliensis]|uniref:DUF7392 domain-containing protein n=1 Tax=Hevea brasiliensis TaxID=3981 RepID=A0A6A6MW10_HEVBR|nr:hypothetical protein GH714_042076 [Hevea brasiliensis]
MNWSTTCQNGKGSNTKVGERPHQRRPCNFCGRKEETGKHFRLLKLNVCVGLRPTMVLVDELIETLKHFSGSTESLGCAQSSILRSIHGNMIIWYGAWMKKSSENKELLTAALLSMLTSISSMAILIEHGFFDAYAGESRDGSSAAKFSTGDAISINIIVPQSGDVNDLSYANLALFKSHFLKMEGASAGVCLNCQSKPKVASLYVWKSLQFCYSWIINSDHRRTMLPYLERFSLDIKYDIFRVVLLAVTTY